jgi:hypothetical protein
MKNKWLLWGAVAVGAYLIYKTMNKDTGNGKELAPPPVSNPSTKPAPSKATGSTSNNNLPIYY